MHRLLADAAFVAFGALLGYVGTVLYGIHSEGLYHVAPAPTPLRRVQ